MRFQLVPKSTTLSGLDGPLCTLFQNTCVFGANHVNLNEDITCLSATKTELSSVICLVSSNITFMRKFAGVPLEIGRQTTVGLSKTAIFNIFAHYFFRSCGGKANVAILSSPSSPFHWPQNT